MLNISYWTYLSGTTEPNVRLDWLYNKRINYLDEEFMLKEENEDYLGDQFDCCIFARKFRMQVVIFSVQSGQNSTTQLYDGTEYNQETGTGLYFSSSDGVHPDRVPSGPEVLQVIRYNTDLGDDIGGGPLHWIRVATSKVEFTRTKGLDNMVDYGVTDSLDDQETAEVDKKDLSGIPPADNSLTSLPAKLDELSEHPTIDDPKPDEEIKQTSKKSNKTGQSPHLETAEDSTIEDPIQKLKPPTPLSKQTAKKSNKDAPNLETPEDSPAADPIPELEPPTPPTTYQ